MNDKAVVKELVAVAKELTASGVKVEKSWRQDRDRYEEVNITATIDRVVYVDADKVIAIISEQKRDIEREVAKVISKFSLKTDPLQPVKVEIRGGRVIIYGGFACDLGFLPREELTRSGFKEVD